MATWRDTDIARNEKRITQESIILSHSLEFFYLPGFSLTKETPFPILERERESFQPTPLQKRTR